MSLRTESIRSPPAVQHAHLRQRARAGQRVAARRERMLAAAARRTGESAAGPSYPPIKPRTAWRVGSEIPGTHEGGSEGQGLALSHRKCGAGSVRRHDLVGGIVRRTENGLPTGAELQGSTRPGGSDPKRARPR
jgi:hypothetical protein